MIGEGRPAGSSRIDLLVELCGNPVDRTSGVASRF